MKNKYALVLLVSLITTGLIAIGCSSSTVTTTIAGATIILPGGTTTLPPITVTLPSGASTIPPTTITVLPLTTTVVTPPAIPQFLPTSPDNVEYSMSALTDCLSCHGPGVYLQFPLPPAWDGSVAMSPNNVGIYSVAAGSIQDHTGRSNNECLTCHQPT